MRRKFLRNKTKLLFYFLKNYKYIIFDLDNTIYDFRDFDYGAFKEIFKFLKIKISESKLIKFINFRQKNLLKKKLIDKYLEKLDIPKNSTKKAISIFRNHKCKYINKKESLNKLLQRLKNKNKLLYMISNGERKRQNKKINKLKIKKYFEKIIICPPKKNKLKPFKFGFDKIYKKKMILKEIVMVGDSEIDKMFAKKCNIKFIKFKYINKRYENT